MMELMELMMMMVLCGDTAWFCFVILITIDSGQNEWRKRGSIARKSTKIEFLKQQKKC
jgi:hypothetical protein